MLYLINYSERAIALTGDTKEHKALLKGLGGRFNAHLRCGAGWIFPAKKADVVLATLKAAGIEVTPKSETNTDVLTF